MSYKLKLNKIRSFAVMSCVLLVPCMLSVKGAQAGGFGLREVSAAGEAVSLAGAAAGAAGLGSIFWNPATLTQFDGLQLGVNSTLIVPYSQMKNQPPTSAGYNAYSNFLGGSFSSGNIGIIGNVPSGQMTYRLSPDLWLGLSLSVPYGQSTKADASYVGRTYGSTTKVASVEVEPMLAYRLSDTVSLGAGIRYLNFSSRYSSAFPGNATPYQWSVLGIAGDGEALGFSLGATFKPWAQTEIGIGYRSEAAIRLGGNFFGGAALASNFGGSAALATATLDQPVKLNLSLPQSVTLGLKQGIDERWTLLGAFEYVQWSTLKAPSVSYANNGSSPVASWTAGQAHPALQTIPLYYRDAWFTSVGTEYRYSPDLLLRGGLAYEKNPLGLNSKSARLPDFNRIWASLGLTYQIAPQWSLDLAYLHIFMLGDHLKIDPTNTGYSPALGAVGLGTLDAKVDARVDIISVGLTYQFTTGASKQK